MFGENNRISACGTGSKPLTQCARAPVPQLGVGHQGLAQHFGSCVSNVVSTDVQLGQSGVAAQSAQKDVHA